MKNKILLAALALPMVFTACSQDELAEMSAPVNKGGDIKVVLSATREGDVNLGSRANWNGTGLEWVSSDKISMYWLGADCSTGENAQYGQSNAVFVTEDNGENFTSESLVYLGSNVAVYPANLSHVSNQLIEISVPASQNDETANSLPYVSNELRISDKNIDKNKAGYHNPVYSPMKMAANVVDLKLDVKNTTALEKYGFNITSVDLVATEAFATTSNIVVTGTKATDEGKQQCTEGTTKQPVSTIEHSVWTAPSVKASTLTSKAITKNADGTYNVRFVVLPTDASVTNAQIIVRTTCGTITLDNNGENVVVREVANPTSADTVTIAEAVAKFTESIVMEASSSNFKGEKVGRRLPRTIAVDAGKAVLNGSKVYSSEDIIRYVNLYTDMKKAESTTDNKMELVMSVDGEEEATTWAALTKEAVEKVNSKNPAKGTALVTLSADETVNAIELTTEGSVYSVAAYNGKELPLILAAGEWRMNDTFEVNTLFTKLVNNGTLTIDGTEVNGVQMTLKGTVENNGTLKVGGDKLLVNGALTTTANSIITVANGQVFTFAEDILPGSLDGVINVAADAKLTTAEGVKVVTNAVINNYGIVAAEGTSNGFYNAGTIWMRDAEATAYLQDNSAGVVRMMERIDEVVVYNENGQGKIVYEYNVANDGVTVVVDEKYDRFNYLMFGNDATKIYLEENGEYKGISLEFTGKTTLEPAECSIADLTVAETGALKIESKRKLYAKNVYLYGDLTIGGTIYYTENYVEKMKPLTQGTGAVVRESGAAANLEVSGDTYTINNVAGMMEFAKLAERDNFSGKTVVLNADINLANVAWTPIAGFRGTFDGNNKTVSNLTATGTENVGLFGSIVGVVKNLYVSNVYVKGTTNVGAIVGYAYGTISGCKATDVTVIAEPALNAEGKYDDGNNAGGIVGYICGEPESYLTDNTVSGARIVAYRDLGGVAGTANGCTKVTGNTVSSLTLTVDRSVEAQYFEEKDVNKGIYVGRNLSTGAVQE